MKKYTKEQILIAAEIGEVSMIDARHIVSLLDEAVILERGRNLRKPNVSKSFYCLGDAWGESGKCNKQCEDCRAKILKQ